MNPSPLFFFYMIPFKLTEKYERSDAGEGYLGVKGGKKPLCGNYFLYRQLSISHDNAIVPAIP